jgi:hypothetical protein
MVWLSSEYFTGEKSSLITILFSCSSSQILLIDIAGKFVLKNKKII